MTEFTDWDPPSCPVCRSPMRKRLSAGGAFWGCPSYPDCQGTRALEDARNTTRADAPPPRPRLRVDEPDPEWEAYHRGEPYPDEEQGNEPPPFGKDGWGGQS